MSKTTRRFADGIVTVLIAIPVLMAFLTVRTPVDAQPSDHKQPRAENPRPTAISDDPRDGEFDREAKRLALRLRTAKPDEQAKLKQELEALNEAHFEYR